MSTLNGPVIVCDACGEKSWIEPSRLGDEALCGACGASLPPPSAPFPLDDESFAPFVRLAERPVVAHFGTPASRPCRVFDPVVSELARRLAGRALVVRVNVAASPETAERLGIEAVPTVGLFREGREVARCGAGSIGELETFAGG